MKKTIIAFLGIIISTATFSQEKVYSTKSATIKFFSSTPLEKIEGVNSQVTAKLGDKEGQFVFLLLVKGFKFDNSLLQDHFNENYMESTKFAKADFKGFITNISTVNFSKDGVYPVTVKGNLTIHGVTKEKTVAGTIEVKGGKVTAKSIFKIGVTEFGIKGKYIGEKIANEVETTVICKFD
ncbi:MAG: YceI family protein [Chitinophagaceae bacterium]